MGAKDILDTVTKVISDGMDTKEKIEDKDNHRQSIDFIMALKHVRNLIKQIKLDTGIDYTQDALDYIGEKVE